MNVSTPTLPSSSPFRWTFWSLCQRLQRLQPNVQPTIPIVFVGSIDPVQMKLVDSIARPDGNITGLTNLATDLIAKRLEVLKELLPNALRVGQLVNSSNPANARRFIAEGQVAAAKLKLTAQVVEVGAPDELERAFSTIEGHIDAMSVANDGMFFN